MHSDPRTIKRHSKQLACDKPWSQEEPCREEVREPRSSRSSGKRPCGSNDVLRLKMVALTQELEQHRRLLDMLLVLVDPEDVQAALWLRQNTPTAEGWEAMALESTPPSELRGIQEEKPW